MNKLSAQDRTAALSAGQIGQSQSLGNQPLAPSIRRMGQVNWVGLWTLCRKEVARFLVVYNQTLAAPLVTTLLFLAIFTLALGRGHTMIGDIQFDVFLAPGLIMMSMIQNAFANTSSSLVSSKMQGNIVDVLMAPLSPFELTLGYAFGGLVRGLLVGVTVAIAMLIFVHVQILHIGVVLFYAVTASMMLSLLGVIGGVWAQKHEQMSVVSNFIITPCAFLSGTFYSIDRLPGLWNYAAHINPFFYMIDGFRYGFIGHAEGSLAIGVTVMIVGNLVLWSTCMWMFASGYRIKA
jgi:ABC-2 type transport system permease protein